MQPTPRRAFPSCASSFVRLIVFAAEARGADGHDLCARAGIDPGVLQDSDARIPQPQVTRLWVLAREATGDETIGLHVARLIGPEALRLWNYSMMLSATLLVAYERAIRDLHLLGDGFQIELQPLGERFALRFSDRAGSSLSDQAFDAALGGFVVFSRWLIKDEHFAPLQVQVSHEAPANVPAYEALFRCPVRFSQPENQLLLSRQDLQRAIPTGNEALVSLYDRYVSTQSARKEQRDLAARVHKIVSALLPRGLPKVESVAAALNMSARTLRRRLREADLSYRDLLDGIRKELSADYLASADTSLKEIAYRLGFSEQSNFYRAFRRWYGMSPGEYRSKVIENANARRRA